MKYAFRANETARNLVALGQFPELTIEPTVFLVELDLDGVTADTIEDRLVDLISDLQVIRDAADENPEASDGARLIINAINERREMIIKDHFKAIEDNASNSTDLIAHDADQESHSLPTGDASTSNSSTQTSGSTEQPEVKEHGTSEESQPAAEDRSAGQRRRRS